MTQCAQEGMHAHSAREIKGSGDGYWRRWAASCQAQPGTGAGRGSGRGRAARIGRERAVFARLPGGKQCRRGTGFGMETEFERRSAHRIVRSVNQTPQAQRGVVPAAVFFIRCGVEHHRCRSQGLAGMLRLMQRPRQQQAQHRQGEQPALDGWA